MAKRIKIKKIFTIVLAVILGIGVITAGVFIFKPKESKRIRPTFQVGSIDNNGKYVKSDESIYSDMFECQGLKIEPNFSTNVKFSVYYYRFDESFIKADTNKTDKYEAPNNDTYRFARIVITPKKTDENSKIRFWNVGGIANDIKIFVNTDQVEIKNLAEVAENGKWVTAEDVPPSDWNKLEPINIENINELAFVFENIDKVSSLVQVYYSNDGETFGDCIFGDINSTTHILTLTKKDSYKYLYVSVHEDVSLKIYKYN